MNRIPTLAGLPDQIEKLAREFENHESSAVELYLIEILRTHAFAIAENIEAYRSLGDVKGNTIPVMNWDATLN